NLNAIADKETEKDKAKPPPKVDGDNDLGLVAFLEYAKAIDAGDNEHVWIAHRWGRSWLEFDAAAGIKGSRFAMQTVRKRIKDRFDDLRRQRDKVGRAYLDATQWAVSNGLLDLIMSKEQENALLAAFMNANAQGDEIVIAAQKACKAVVAKLDQQKSQ